MAKRISSKDLFEQEDIFKGVRDSAETTIKKLDGLKQGLVGLAKETKSAFSSVKIDNVQSLNQLIKLVEKANKINKEAIAIDKARKQSLDNKTKAEVQLQIIEREKQKTAQETLKTQRLQAQEEARLNKEKEKSTKVTNDQANAYKRLEKNTRDLKNQSKQIGATLLELASKGQKNSAEYQKLTRQYQQVTAAAKKGDEQLKKLDKTVGDNFRNVGNYQSALSGLKGALGTLGIAVTGASVFSNTFNIIKNFDQAQADLSAISGKTKEELAGLTEQAKKLGETTQFSATEITNMQIELAKLGFTTDQITQSTSAIANFAAATGADIPSAAALAGSALRGFNLDASEMERAVSVMGVATTKTALDSVSTSGSSGRLPAALTMGPKVPAARLFP